MMQIIMNNNMVKLEFNTWDFYIRTLDSGQEVLQLKGTIAFDESMIKYAKEIGVRDEITDIDLEKEETGTEHLEKIKEDK